MTSRLKPRRSVQRTYIRRSISAQSCDSVPPAPGWIVMMAFLRSCSPAEHLLGFAGLDLGAELVEAAPEILGDRLPCLGPLDEDGEVVDAALQRLAHVDVVFEPAAALQQLLRRRPGPSRNPGPTPSALSSRARPRDGRRQR